MIRLLFTGDIMLSREVGLKLDKENNKMILSKDVIDYLKKSDFVIGNLENPISISAKKNNDKKFRANPNYLNQISKFNLVSLANNHILDCGDDGALDTIKNLEKHNILYNGISIDNKIKSTEINIKNKSIGFLSLLDFGTFSNYALNSKIKPFSANDIKALKVINKMSNKNDFVIILLHGDNEMVNYPSPRFRKICKKLISNGADLVITHHPHVIGGYEKYKNRNIYYSLGDFIFDGQSYLRRKSCMLQITLTDSKMSHKIIPTIISSDLEVEIADKKNDFIIKNKFFKTSLNLSDKSYDSKYKARHAISLLKFQLDRINFLFKNKGFSFTFKFIFGRIFLLKYYFNLIRKQ